jgi:toxin ParE1/3/4
MTGYVLSPLAEADIDSIWDYTAENWSGDRANRYVRDIHAACEQLASGRRIGRSIDDIRPGIPQNLCRIAFRRLSDR